MIANNTPIVATRERGQVMVLVCVSLIAIMGMIAVVADFSFMQHQRNMMQTAADSAAMAGAAELNYGDVAAAGKADSATNGYTDGQSSVTVAINNPPSAGPNAGNAAYVEAIVSKPEPTYFLRVLGVSSMTVSTRAVAYEGSGPNCIYVTNPSAGPAMSNSGNVTVQSNCGLLVDSSASNGLAANGSVTITAPTIGVVGNYTTSGGASFTPTPKTGVIAASDPLTSGTYILAGGGMSISSNTVLTGTAVTYYNTTGTGGYGAISMNGNTSTNLSAPTSGPLAGILFFQDRAIPGTAAGSTISGNSTSTFDGAVYFPTTQLTFNGNSSVGGYSIVVADRLVLSGNSSLGNNYSSLTNGSPIKGTVLAE